MIMRVEQLSQIILLIVIGQNQPRRCLSLGTKRLSVAELSKKPMGLSVEEMNLLGVDREL